MNEGRNGGMNEQTFENATKYLKNLKTLVNIWNHLEWCYHRILSKNTRANVISDVILNPVLIILELTQP